MHKTGGFLHIQQILRCDTKRARRDMEFAPQQLYAHFFNKFFKAPVVLCNRFCRFDAYIAEMPALGDKAGELLFFCRKADDKPIFRAMLMKPDA